MQPLAPCETAALERADDPDEFIGTMLAIIALNDPDPHPEITGSRYAGDVTAAFHVLGRPVHVNGISLPDGGYYVESVWGNPPRDCDGEIVLSTL